MDHHTMEDEFFDRVVECYDVESVVDILKIDIADLVRRLRTEIWVARDRFSLAYDFPIEGDDEDEHDDY